MKVRITAFQDPPGGKSQDYYSVVVGNDPLVRVVVADGAGTHFMSGRFAKELCLAGQAKGCHELAKMQQEATEAWLDRSRPSSTDEWWKRERFELGSAAALITLQVSPSIWRVRSVGDCQLVHLAGRRRVTWPFSKSGDFPNFPSLVSTVSPDLETKKRWGRHKPGSVFLLMTDTLGKAVLRLHEAGYETWSELRALETESDFSAFVAELYERLPDHDIDDLTLVRIQLEV